MMRVLRMHIHGEEASDLLCSLAGMLKIHLSDSGIKVHVPEPFVYKLSKLYVYTVQRFRVHCSIPGIRERG